jgi:hypothetical protein
MSKRVYHLTIEFDSETEEVEYIVETVEKVDDGIVELTQIGRVDLEDHFDEEDIKLILEAYEIGEA